MAANSKLASATQILCVLAYLGDGATSETIARSLHTNPVVVRRLLKSMERAGLVELRPGRDGGASFARSADEITLDQIYAAVDDEGQVFALRGDGNPRCPVNQAMPRMLEPVFASAHQAVTQVLGRTTIGSLARNMGATGDLKQNRTGSGLNAGVL